jgi:hypothetical protein
VANLRETKKAVATARQRHPAGKALPKPGPAKAPAKAAPTKAGQIRWTYPEGRDNRKGNPQTGLAGEATYELKPEANGWKATVTRGGKTVVLATGVSRGKAYAVCVADAKKAVAA